MRLINSATHKLVEFSGVIPEYAILSHTWEKEELSFHDIQGGNAKNMAGYAKVEGCCLKAQLDCIDYVWIDTCCIDKTSSAELSEAINSMYRWYKEAQVCYAYLADVPSGEALQSADSPFVKSRWFRRGWTLQELIAPSSLVFYGNDWVEIGTKLSLQKLVCAITGIPIDVLKFGDVGEFSVAQRMSWASKRQTTRVEDMAYCLMGLFGVNMPMLYGEGERAFERLQEEIMKTSDDHTLFAWTRQSHEHSRPTRGLLADSPVEFIESGDIIRSEPILKSAPYSMTNKGLRIELPLLQAKSQQCLAILNCHRLSNVNEFLAIGLKQISSDKEEYFARRFAHKSYSVSGEKVGNSQLRTVYIVQNNVEEPSLWEKGLFRTSLVMKLRGARESSCNWKFYPKLKESRELGDGCFQFAGRRTGVLAVLKPIHTNDAEAFVVVLGHHKGLPWCDVVPDISNKNMAEIYDTYETASYVDCLDRTTKSLQAGISVSVAIRKKGRAEIALEAEYTVHVSVHIN
jgi:hypothetical protein